MSISSFILKIFGVQTFSDKTGEWALVLCPFHEEKTPSCAVSITKRVFHCFSCRRSGTDEEFIEASKRQRTMEDYKLKGGHHGQGA